MLLVIQPQNALLLGLLLLFLMAIIFLPGKGLIARWTKMRMNTRKVKLEDALKYLFDCEYKNIPCRLSAIAGNMHLSGDQATRIIEHLQKIGLVKSKSGLLLLTDAGRSYALQIIRVHRIWERYLADETGTMNKDWHGSADLVEHQMSLQEADRLAAKMGNPVFDPHGDPIPSIGGTMPQHKDNTLSNLQEGDIARIVHVEDEPAVIYAQLLALDLYPGVQIYVMDVSDKKIQFAANGEECALTPLFASSVNVELLPAESPIQTKQDALASLEIGKKASIIGISPKCRGQERRRMMDLGLIPGALVQTLLKSAAGDPTAYRVMGATIALRKSQAQNIFIHRLNESPNGSK
jgi:DtxR family Mn-dependent transcriptional regulator